jgi:uncharacterized membrane protein
MISSNESLHIVTICAAVGCGLMAGLLFAFSNFVMKALSRQAPESSVRAMQAINAFIQNPVFFLVYFGTTLTTAFLAVTAAVELSQPGAALQLAGCVVYWVGTFAVTVAVHMPLNNSLATHDPKTAETTRYWFYYVGRWLPWNHVRTVCALAATALLILSVHQQAHA